MNTVNKKKLNNALNVLLDVAILIALILAMAVAIIVTVQRTTNGFAGFGTVQSSSMKASGLNVGDMVKVRPKDKYNRGDIIVFYRAPKMYDQPFEAEKVRHCEIWVHEVIDVRKDNLGRNTYLTKGSSNATDDKAYVPQDYVLGKATKLRNSTVAVLRFVCSVKGIILLVELPCALVLVYLVWDLVMYFTTDEKSTTTTQYTIK